MKEAKREPKLIGRPPVDTEAMTLRVQRTLLAKLDDWRRIQPDIPTRPEAMRRIVEKVLSK